MSNLSGQAIRDFLLSAIPVVVSAILEYSTGWLSAHPLPSATANALAVALIGMIRRYLNPTIPVATIDKAIKEIGANRSLLPIPGFADAPPKLALDFPTPPHSFSVANDQSDEQFLLSCAGQVNAYAPAENGRVKQFDPATIIAILSWLLTHRDDIESLIAKVKSWLGFLFKAKLRKAIVAAAVDTGNLAVARGHAPLVDGFESWLLKTDAGVLARVKRIASERGTATFS